MRQVSKRRKTRVGKLGIVRLVGEDLEALRRACFERDGYRCQNVIIERLPFLGGTVISNIFTCNKLGTWNTLEMAHLRTKRNNGDTLDNVITMCRECHAKSHNCNGKPCPPKAVTA